MKQANIVRQTLIAACATFMLSSGAQAFTINSEGETAQAEFIVDSDQKLAISITANGSVVKPESGATGTVPAFTFTASATGISDHLGVNSSYHTAQGYWGAMGPDGQIYELLDQYADCQNGGKYLTNISYGNVTMYCSKPGDNKLTVALHIKASDLAKGGAGKYTSALQVVTMTP